MSDNFYDFLDKMDSQFNINKTKDFLKEESFEEESFEEESFEEEKEDFKDYKQEEQEEQEDDNIVEKSLDYARSVLKVVRENFKNKDQKIMLETLRNALNMYLNESHTEMQVQSYSNTLKSSPMLKGATITEEEWKNMDTNNVINFQPQIPAEQLSPQSNVQESIDRTYKKELPLAIRVNANGKPEVDLSKISSRDVDDMKVLMGLK